MNILRWREEGGGNDFEVKELDERVRGRIYGGRGKGVGVDCGE
jgi:hypothetical protein